MCVSFVYVNKYFYEANWVSVMHARLYLGAAVSYLECKSLSL